MSTRSTPLPATGRVLAVIAVIALAGAIVLAIAGTRAAGGDDAVLVVEDAVAEAPPSTVPPVVTTTTEPAPSSTVTVDDDADLYPLADLLGETGSAIPEDIEPRPKPVGLQISTIDVADFPVREVGLEDDGQLEIPDETEIGWYKYGATAGRPGATVLAAHVSWNRTQGPFFRLGAVDPGDQVEVALDDGTTRNYEVVERTMYGKLELPRERIWRNTGPETLVLITCGGEFNPDIRRFDSNIVVYAVPVEPPAPDAANAS